MIDVFSIITVISFISLGNRARVSVHIRLLTLKYLEEDPRNVEAFKEEINKLRNLAVKEGAKGVSPFSRVDPFLDQNNLVRIGGRIKQASLFQDT